MSDTMDLNEDDGFTLVKISGEERRIDLWKVWARICDYHKLNQNRSREEYYEGILDLMVSFGLPRGSQRLGQRFVQSIMDAVAEKKNPPGKSPDAVASSDSTPAP